MAKQLEEYNKKRDFKKTPEPAGQPAAAGEALRFVVQKHAASRLHFDFRLEHDGVLWSWAVPKGPSYNPKDKRLAVQVEDHPLEYRNFEGTIPKGEYGGGTVMLFDEGVWIPLFDPVKGLADGSLKFTLKGERLKGRWTLIRLKPREGEEDKNWLLIKEKDEFVKESDGISEILTSVRSGRTLEDISKDPPKAPEAEDETPETQKQKEKAKTQKKSDISAKENTKAAQPPAKSKAEKIQLPDLSGSLPFKEAKPMLAALVKKAPKGNEWIHELKLDGYRILTFLEGGKARLLTRNGHDWSEKIPDLIETLEGWNPGNLVLDGELVVMDEKGKSDFQALQSFFKKNQELAADYVIFDLLALGAEDLRQRPLLERKAFLEELLKNSPDGLHYNPHTEGSAIFEKVCEADLEGIISKKKNSPYRSTRSKDWVKTKCEYRQEFVIGGYTTSDKSSTGLSSLLLGGYEGKDLIFKGRSGTGFSQTEAVDLMKQFKKLIRKTSPFTEKLKPRTDETITYLDPALVAEVKFAEITDDGLLRQASFKGLREDKPAIEVTSEIPEEISPENSSEEASGETNEDPIETTAKKKTSRRKPEAPELTEARREAPEAAHKKARPDAKSGGRSPADAVAYEKKDPDEKKAVEPTGSSKKKPTVLYGDISLSSPDKPVFPEDGLTKKAIADYYWEMRDKILPYLADRPMTLIRCTDGIGDCFFQKHMNQTIPGMDTVTLPDNDGKPFEAMILRDETSLMGAVQMGTLEFHGWGSKLDKVEQPDWLVFDLDPDEGMDLATVRQGVRDLKSLLDEMGLIAFLKTSGGKGYHIVVPLSPSAQWEQTRGFAKLLAQSMEVKWPDRYTANMRKEKRKGRIYIDWVRNGRSATSVSIFSLRGRKGAPLSWPISWADLDRVAPNQVTLKNYKDYLKTIKSWEQFFSVKQRIK